jgi:hypothetical protein
MIVGDQSFAAPRMLSLNAQQTTENLTRFERAALNRFVSDPDRAFHSAEYPLKDGSLGYRYAQPLRARQQCMPCHLNSVLPSSPLFPLASYPPPATRPTRQAPPLLGMISVDIPSQN